LGGPEQTERERTLKNSPLADPAERSPLLRLFYRDWRPTRIGRWVNRFAKWWTSLGLASKEMAVLEVRGRASGQLRSTPVVVATVEGKRYLVSMLGPESEWVRNVEAARGEAVLRQGGQRAVHLVAVPTSERAPILREYVHVATSGRHHFPVAVGAPLSEFQLIAERYPVYRIDLQ
jgi:deazaflavin-dependent oxidoreductase (nitroreductase family)